MVITVPEDMETDMFPKSGPVFLHSQRYIFLLCFLFVCLRQIIFIRLYYISQKTDIIDIISNMTILLILLPTNNKHVTLIVLPYLVSI